MGKAPEQRFLKRRYMDGQQAYEKMLNIISYQETQIKTTMRYDLTPIRMAIIKRQEISVGEDAEIREPSYAAGENANLRSH